MVLGYAMQWVVGLSLFKKKKLFCFFCFVSKKKSSLLPFSLRSQNVLVCLYVYCVRCYLIAWVRARASQEIKTCNRYTKLHSYTQHCCCYSSFFCCLFKSSFVVFRIIRMCFMCLHCRTDHHHCFLVWRREKTSEFDVKSIKKIEMDKRM